MQVGYKTLAIFDKYSVSGRISEAVQNKDIVTIVSSYCSNKVLFDVI